MSDQPIETTIAPWLAVSDGAKALEFYMAALGAVDAYCLDGDDQEALVAQLRVGGAAFWISADRASSPKPVDKGSVRMILTVSDPDALFERAITAGATEVAPVHEEHGWRTGRVTDPFGHDWEFGRPLATGD